MIKYVIVGQKIFINDNANVGFSDNDHDHLEV